MSEITHWDGPPLEAWAGAWTPQEAGLALAGLDVPWCVVGGWAIDLFLGRVTRKHEDLEIAVPRMFFPAIRSHLERRYALHVVGDGEVRRMKAGGTLPPEKHQCWVLDEAANQWRVDVMSEPGDAQTWIARRDQRITAPRALIIKQSRDGIPYLAPEAALLFKAKAARPKDEADLANALPLLSRDSRVWLRDALTIAHPDHAWLKHLL